MNTEVTVKEIIEKVIGVYPKSNDTFNSLNADELDMIDIIMKVEIELSISIPYNDMEAIRSVNELVQYVDKKIK